MGNNTSKGDIWGTKLVEIYVNEIIRLHDVSISIVSDKGP